MGYFDRYESVSTKNKWSRLLNDSNKKKETTRILSDEQQGRDKLKKKDEEYYTSLSSTGTTLNRRKRDRTTSYTSTTPTPAPLTKKYGTAAQLEAYRKYSSRFSGGGRGSFAPQSYEEFTNNAAQKEAEEKAEQEQELLDLSTKKTNNETAQNTQQFVSALNFNDPVAFAVRYALNPTNYIELDSFGDEEVRDFVTDVRSGDYEALETLRSRPDVIRALVRETANHFISKRELPNTYTVETEMFAEDDTFAFAPTVREYLSFTPDELISQFNNPFEIDPDTGQRISPRRTVFPESGTGFLLNDEEARNAAVWTMTEKQQSNFVASWIESQMYLIEDGNFDQIEAVPVLGPMFQEILKEKLDMLLNRHSPVSDSESDELMFLSLISGFEEIPITDEQMAKLNEYYDPLIDKEFKEISGMNLDIKDTAVGALKQVGLNVLQGVGPLGDTLPDSSEIGPRREDTKTGKELKSIIDSQAGIRGVDIDPTYVEKLMDTTTAKGLQGLMYAFDKGEDISRPFVQKILMPMLEAQMDFQTGQFLTTPKEERASATLVNNKIVEFGLVEALNPANVMFVIPFVGPGSRFIRAVQTGNKLLAASILADEFMLLGNTPAAVDGIMRGVVYASRHGLKGALHTFPELASNKAFMGLMRGADNKVVRREVEHEVGRVTAANADTIHHNKVLEALLGRGDKSVDEAKKGLDEGVFEKIAADYDSGRIEYPLKDFDPETAKGVLGEESDVFGPDLVRGERLNQVKRALEGKSTVGEGFASGRKSFGAKFGDDVVPVTDAFTRLRANRFETFGETEQLLEEMGATRRELGEALQKNLPIEQTDAMQSKIDNLEIEVSARGNEPGAGNVFKSTDEGTDEWYLQQENIDEGASAVNRKDALAIGHVMSDPTSKPFGSGTIYDPIDEAYENKVAFTVRETKKIQAETTGREFYFRESFDEAQDGYSFTVFGVSDEAAEFIRANPDGLPTNVEDFVKLVDGGKITGDQKIFVDKLFNLGKPADQLDALDDVGRALGSKINKHVDSMDNVSKAKQATKEGRQAMVDEQKSMIETIAYGIVRDDPELQARLVKRLNQVYEEFANLPIDSHGLLNEFGHFFDTGDELPVTAIKKLWDEQVPNARRFVTQTRASESDSALAAITRFMDETGTITITRVGDDKIVVDAVRYIGEQQAKAIKGLVANEGITDISFSFDKVFGVRAGGRQTLFKGKTGKAFDDILDQSTGVCSL